MNYYLLHGLLQFVAFVILFPIGAMIAWFRESIGPSWKAYHIFFQLTGAVTVFVAICSILYAKAQSKKNKEEHAKKPENILRKIHKILGPIVVTVVFVQILWAFYGRKVVEWMTWYQIHIVFSMIIIFGGVSNVLLGLQM